MSEVTTVQNEQKNLHRNRALDGLRGVGCILVLLGHTQWKEGTILPGAAIAMDIFFVLSGFLITGLLLAEYKKTQTINLLNFWKRRAIRLLPVFYAYFAFGSIFYYFSKFHPIVGTDGTVTLLSTAFYGSNWAMAKGYQLGIFAVTWSLSLEEQFYFLCPILFIIGFKYLSKKTLIAFLGLAIVLVNIHRIYLYNELLAAQGIMAAFKRCFYGLDTRSDALLIGCLGALVYDLYGNKIRIGLRIAIPAFIVFLIAIATRDFPLAYHKAQSSFFSDFLVHGGFTFFSIIGLIFVVHVVQHPKSILTKFFSLNILIQIGLMSYSIYIWHTTVFGGLEIVLKSMNQNALLWSLKTLIRFSVAFGLGYLSFRYIELPVLRYLFQKRKFEPLTLKSEG